MTARRTLMLLGLVAALAAQGCCQRTALYRTVEDTEKTIEGEPVVVPHSQDRPGLGTAKPSPGVKKEETETTIERRVIDRETVP